MNNILIKNLLRLTAFLLIGLYSCDDNKEEQSGQNQETCVDNDILPIYFDSISSIFDVQYVLESSVCDNFLLVEFIDSSGSIKGDTLIVDFFIQNLYHAPIESFKNEGIDSIKATIKSSELLEIMYYRNSLENLVAEKSKQKQYNKYYELINYIVSNKLYEELEGLNYIMTEMSEDYEPSMADYNGSFLFLSRCYYDECLTQLNDNHYDKLLLLALMQVYSSSPRPLEIINYVITSCDKSPMTKEKIIKTYNDLGQSVSISW